MTVDELIGKTYKRLKEKDFSQVDKIAVQVNLSGRIPGVFYIEILNGVLSVMPYEYLDRDALITISMTNFNKLLAGNLNPQLAFATGLIKVEGNLTKVLRLAETLQKAAV